VSHYVMDAGTCHGFVTPFQKVWIFIRLTLSNSPSCHMFCHQGGVDIMFHIGLKNTLQVSQFKEYLICLVDLFSL
jgi:hypothetical protein